MRMAEKLTCSAPTITARVPTRWRAIANCCNDPVVNIPLGRSPGTSRAERGRSRAPVARITASASMSSIEKMAVPGTRHQTVKVADSEPGVIGMSRNPTGTLLALEQGYVADTQSPQFDGRGQSRWTGTNDHNATIERTHGATLQPIRLHSSARQ